MIYSGARRPLDLRPPGADRIVQPRSRDGRMCAAWCLLQMLAAYVHATRPPVACRRSVLIGGAATAASVVDVSRAAAAVQPAATTARMSREEAVERTLSRVPVFAVANQEGLPYLTESTKEGKRTGSIYLGLREAVALLEAVRVYDANATLAVVPLASIFSTAAKSSAELESQVAASVETSRRLGQGRLAGQHGPAGRSAASSAGIFWRW